MTPQSAEYPGHIAGACARIIRYTACMTEEDWLADEMARDAVCRQIEIIGKAGNR
jgi:uncharacterized protein with HEPN domain